MTSNYVHKFPQSLCEFPVCTGIFCLSSLCALVVCASAGVLGPTEMSCVRIWFHFPPALTQSARCRARSPAACVLTSAPEWMQARYQAPVRGRTQRLRILNPAALGNFWRDTDMRERQGNSVEGGHEKGFRNKNWSFLIEGVTRRFLALACSALIETMRLQYTSFYLISDLQVTTIKSCLHNFCKQDQILESYPIKVSCFKEFYRLIW